VFIIFFMTSLTILIPTTGNLDKLKINLLFLIKQTSKDFKIFIGNNSSNNLEPFLNNFRKQLRIKLYNNNKDIGFANNLHNLISKVQTKYFLLCSDDDYLLPGAIKETLYAFKIFLNCSVVRLGFINTQDNYLKNKNYLKTYYKKTFSKKIFHINNINLDDKHLKILDNLDNLSGIAFKRSCFKHYMHMGICSCYLGNVLQNTIKKNYIFIDKALIIITRGDLSSLSYTKNVMKDLIKYLSSIKKFRNLLLLYLNKYYFYYLLTIIIISENFSSDYKLINKYIKINFFKKIILLLLNIIIIKSIKKYLIIIHLFITKNFAKKKLYYFIK
jgi:hypothetical protein